LVIEQDARQTTRKDTSMWITKRDALLIMCARQQSPAQAEISAKRYADLTACA